MRAKPVRTQFDHLWSQHYSMAAPLGHHLKAMYGLYWFRVHSLPHGKRYPTTPAEVSELLSRQETVAEAVLGRRTLRVFAAHTGLVHTTHPEADPIGGFDDGRGDSAENFYAVPYDWVFADALWDLLAVANNGPQSIWLDIDSGGVFAPYDGGVDAFLPEPQSLRDALLRLRANSDVGGVLSIDEPG